MLGDVVNDNRSRLLVFGLSSLPIVAWTIGGFSDSLRLARESTLFLFSPAPNRPPSVVPLLGDLPDVRSGLLGGLSFFLDPDVNTPLILVPGEIPRAFLEVASSAALSEISLCREPIVAACRGARLVPVEESLLGVGDVVVFWAWEDLVVKLSN